jgi:hypothetical protein
MDFPGKTANSSEGDAFSDAFSDSRLVKLIEVWPALSDEVRGAVLALVESGLSSRNIALVDRALSGDSAG